MDDQRRLGTRDPYAGPSTTRPTRYKPESATLADGSRQGGRIMVTRDHDVIRHWAEQRGARPATMPGSEYNGRLGVLRFDFPGYGGAVLRAVGWDEWFATFDARRLIFRYQERRADGGPSNFNRLEQAVGEG
jgi:hypothetical protein